MSSLHNGLKKNKPTKNQFHIWSTVLALYQDIPLILEWNLLSASSEATKLSFLNLPLP